MPTWTGGTRAPAPWPPPGCDPATPLPTAQELLARAVVVDLPLRTRFRGLDRREALVLRGPAGWAELAPFLEYDDEEAAWWLAAAVEAAWLGPPPPLRTEVPVNATVPAVPTGDVAAVIARTPGARTAKVKVAEPGVPPARSLAEDLDRVAAAREALGAGGRLRVDANGGWSPEQAERALTALRAQGPLEYAEQPCADVAGLVALRARLAAAGVDVPVAADESVRRAQDPLAVVRARAADVAVLKVPPLGGGRAVLALAELLRREHGVPVVVSSALDTAVGIAAGVRAAAALPGLAHACGLATGSLLARDVAPPLVVSAGALPVAEADRVLAGVDPADLEALAAPPDRARWWADRLRRARSVLARSAPAGRPAHHPTTRPSPG
ncbi:o-succinylbenzoate synthase [Pseudokineococcus basanitobsidens]|uniref:o-succinylbenzoate synthase n=1 Tax=Pseudokineococcus basanitobsidens TaxID=1926649 RepID=A0ABU8RGW2_9ACTN